MSTRGQWLLVAGVVVLLGGGLAAALAFTRGGSAVEVGARAPAFSARSIAASGRVHSLADYAGQVVLLNVWATWCGPCRVEMPSIERLHQAYGRRGLRVVAVSIDEVASDADIRAYAQELGLTFEILHDSAGAITKAYQVVGFPSTFVIARDGTIRKMHLGPADWASPANRALVAELLGLGRESESEPRAEHRALAAPRALAAAAEGER